MCGFVLENALTRNDYCTSYLDTSVSTADHLRCMQCDDGVCTSGKSPTTGAVQCADELFCETSGHGLGNAATEGAAHHRCTTVYSLRQPLQCISCSANENR